MQTSDSPNYQDSQTGSLFWRLHDEAHSQSAFRARTLPTPKCAASMTSCQLQCLGRATSSHLRSANLAYFDAHLAPIVGKLFAAIQTHDVGARTYGT